MEKEFRIIQSLSVLKIFVFQHLSRICVDAQAKAIRAKNTMSGCDCSLKTEYHCVFKQRRIFVGVDQGLRHVCSFFSFFVVVWLRYYVSNVFVRFEITVTVPFFVFPCSFWSK